MPKPTVIVNVFSSVDGRITTAPKRNVEEWAALGLDGNANQAAHLLCDELECDGMISGSESILVWSRHSVQLQRPIHWPIKLRAFIVFDGRGRITWTQTDGLLVVTCADSAQSYIDELRRRQIDFIQAGHAGRINLSDALEQLYARGFRKLALTGGGIINGGFLRSGLVDEISLVIAPVAVGGRTTPTTFDCPDLPSPEGMTRLQLLQATPIGEGCIWLHYAVIR